MYPKHNYIRSKKHLQKVASLNCQLCGSERWVQAAHSNWGGGKGRGIKADDNLTAALCMSCHFDIDQGKELTKEQRKDLWIQAHQKTVEKMQAMGIWANDIPIPDVSKLL